MICLKVTINKTKAIETFNKYNMIADRWIRIPVETLSRLSVRKAYARCPEHKQSNYQAENIIYNQLLFLFKEVIHQNNASLKL